MAPALSVFAKLGIDTANPVTVPFDFKRSTLAVDEDFIDTSGNRGTKERPIERNLQGNRRVQGQLELMPTAVELASLLPWILGGTPSGTSYPLAETITTRYVTIDEVIKVPTYNGVGVDKATFEATEGEALKLTLDLVGIDETVGNAASFPSLTLDVTTQPFRFTDLALTIAGATRTPKRFKLVIDNKIKKDRNFNSQTLTAVVSEDREISFDTELPYGDAQAAYNTGAAGVAVVATFTSGNTSLVFSLVKVAAPRKSPGVDGRTEIMLPWSGKAFHSGATDSLVTTLDSTP